MWLECKRIHTSVKVDEDKEPFPLLIILMVSPLLSDSRKYKKKGRRRREKPLLNLPINSNPRLNVTIFTVLDGHLMATKIFAPLQVGNGYTPHSSRGGRTI